ncbi:TPA: yersiniabactin biosynthesis salicylate synthase YbtS [Escherichia coli]|nr:yersiniabactin biosynthesis salicylate synthase YbtS [Escherichia coli]
MKISEFLHLALPEEQWLPTISGVLRQFAEEECYVYERQPCWYLGKGCQARLHINADGTQATFIDDAGEQKWAVDSIADCARRFMAHPQVKGRRVYGQVGFNFAAHARGIAFNAGEWPLLTLTVPREELIFEKGNVTVYADSADGCRRLCEWVKEAGTTTQNAPLAVDTALNGEAYKQQVARAVAEIRRGEYVKVIVSRAIPLPSRIDMPATLLYGRQANTPVRSFMFRQEGREALGFSPELVMSVTGNKVVTEPLAGTRDRMGNPEHNKAKEAELLHDSKEVLEHILSVKEAIAELEAVCQPGSVVVEDLMSVRQRGSVQHLGSGVSGQLAENKDAWDAFTVLFPSSTASGIPKNAALNAIMQIEKTPRELYSGAILLLDDTRFDAALVLRSVFQDSQRCWIQAGAGIIAQSTPERELTETREKLASIAPYLMV